MFSMKFKGKSQESEIAGTRSPEEGFKKVDGSMGDLSRRRIPRAKKIRQEEMGKR